jgi:hypothetical protein
VSNVNNIEFRKRLSDITEERELEQHEELVAKLNNEHPHSIILKIKKPDGKRSNYNCYTFAFNLTDSPVYEKIANTPPYDVFANSEFCDFLLKKGILDEKKWDDTNEGDIIIYFEEGTPKHAGKIHSDRIISKWGTGHLWEHDIYEVPISYGSEYRILSAISGDVTIGTFIEYAKSKGMTFVA